MIAVIPFTRFLVGTTIGNNATIVPLCTAAPFVARLVESSLLGSGPRCCRRSRPEHGRHNLANCKQGSTCRRRCPHADQWQRGILHYDSRLFGDGPARLAAGASPSWPIMYGYNRYQTDIMIITVVLLYSHCAGFPEYWKLGYKEVRQTRRIRRTFGTR